MARRAGCWGSP